MNSSEKLFTPGKLYCCIYELQACLKGSNAYDDPIVVPENTPLFAIDYVWPAPESLGHAYASPTYRATFLYNEKLITHSGRKELIVNGAWKDAITLEKVKCVDDV